MHFQHSNITKQTNTQRPQNIHLIKTIQFGHFNNITCFIPMQFPFTLKPSVPFIRAEAEWGTSLKNLVLWLFDVERVWKHEAIMMLMWRAEPRSPSLLAFLSDEAARCQKYMQEHWIKHLTHWLSDWWLDRRRHCRDWGLWDSRHLSTQLITQDNEKVCVKSSIRLREGAVPQAVVLIPTLTTVAIPVFLQTETCTVWAWKSICVFPVTSESCTPCTCKVPKFHLHHSPYK